jgi:N-acetylneuraminic acid mutarotase
MVSSKTLFIFSVVALLILVPNRQVHGDQWVTKNSMSAARSFLSTVVVNGTLYTIGGGLDLNTAIPVVEAYDVATNSWTRKADMPWAYCGTAACAVNDKIYVIGGAWSVLGSDMATVFEYTPASNTWTWKTDMPTAKGFAAAGVVNGKIYLIGGASASLASAYNTVHEYNPATDTWTKKADMPTARFASSAAVVDGKIYVFGGAATISLTGLSVVEAYDPVTDTWTTKAPMPTSRYSQATDVVNGKIYAIGGGLGFGTASAVVEEYNPVSNAWVTKTPMPTARWALALASVGGKMYAMGGASASNVVLSTVEEYTPDVVAPGTPTLLSPPDGAINIQLTATLTWNVVTDAAGYHLQVSTTSSFTTNLINDTTLTGTTTSISSLALNTTYYWRVRSKNAGGYSAFSNARSFKTILTTGIASPAGSIPSEHALSQNYPNPFNPSTNIRFSVAQAGHVSLKIYNVLGVEVASILNEQKEAGTFDVNWNAAGLPSGMYLCRFSVRTDRGQLFNQEKKLMLLK